VAADRFRHFVAIDWSGAAGERHRGIAVGLCASGDAAPRLVRPGHRWSRPEVLDWLTSEMPPDSLVGFDMSTSLAHADKGAFFPGWADSPPDARSLWAMVDALCEEEPHLCANAFVDHAEAARHFRRHGGREGDLFGGGRGRFRVTEEAQARMGCRPYSNFNLVGAAQVGKASLTGMRLLNRLPERLPVWPIDPLPAKGSVVVEIYTTLAALEAGRTAAKSKMRSIEELNVALAALGSEQVEGTGMVDDHSSDALLASAWLRRAANRPQLWHPCDLTHEIARTEGWTFGAA
jgi:hypothetical protein